MKSLQLDKPHAIVMVGIQGSGKSFFAEKFADTFHAPYLDHHMLARLGGSENSANELTDYLLTQLLRSKQSIVLELDTTTKAKRSELARKLTKAGYAPLFVWVQVDADTAASRTQKNLGVHPQQYIQTLKMFQPPDGHEKPLVISGKHTYATQARVVLKKLSAPRAAAQPVLQRTRPTRGQIIVR